MMPQAEEWQRPIRTALREAPRALRGPLLWQVSDFVQQADFLRKALRVQAQLSRRDCLELTPDEQAAQQQQQQHAHARPVEAIPAEAEAQLCSAFALANTLTPALEQDVASALHLSAATVHRWFEDRTAALRDACRTLSRKAKPRSDDGAYSLASARGTAGVRVPIKAAMPAAGACIASRCCSSGG